MNRLTILAIASIVSGCYSLPKDFATNGRSPILNNQAEETVDCGNKANCDLAWKAAKRYAMIKSPYGIQSASAIVIRTNDPDAYSPDNDPIYGAFRHPHQNTVRVSVQCGFGQPTCSTGLADNLAAAYANYVRNSFAVQTKEVVK